MISLVTFLLGSLVSLSSVPLSVCLCYVPVCDPLGFPHLVPMFPSFVYSIVFILSHLLSPHGSPVSLPCSGFCLVVLFSPSSGVPVFSLLRFSPLGVSA